VDQLYFNAKGNVSDIGTIASLHHDAVKGSSPDAIQVRSEEENPYNLKKRIQLTCLHQVYVSMLKSSNLCFDTLRLA
jgi:hypothetical protein